MSLSRARIREWEAESKWAFTIEVISAAMFARQPLAVSSSVMFELSTGGYVVRLHIALSKSVRIDLPPPRVSWIEH